MKHNKLYSIIMLFFVSVSAYTLNIGNNGFIDFSAGAIGVLNTRILAQTNRSNFVFEDTMAGLLLSAQTDIPDFLNLYGRLAFMYPFGYTFNKVAHSYKNIFCFSIDLAAGPVFSFPFFWTTKLNFMPVFHCNYFLEDRFSFITIGAGAGVQLAIPAFKRRKFDLTYMFTYDFIDTGSNATMEPLSHRYMHEISITFTIF